jgi:hypothetical protein
MLTRKEDALANKAGDRRDRNVALYREMAASCRKMAAQSRRPGPLLLRAEYYDNAAADLERVQVG